MLEIVEVRHNLSNSTLARLFCSDDRTFCRISVDTSRDMEASAQWMIRTTPGKGVGGVELWCSSMKRSQNF